MNRFLNALSLPAFEAYESQKHFCRHVSRITAILLIVVCAMTIGILHAPLAKAEELETADSGAPSENVTLTITALDEKNESSEATEIWLKKVFVDGREFAPEDVFTGAWLQDEECLKWRSYDEDAEKNQTLTGSFPGDANVQLVFETSKWRGLARIDVNGRSRTVDTYDPNDHPGTKTRQFDIPLSDSMSVDDASSATVTINALDDKNKASSATEIWLGKVIIDGWEYAPEDVFEGEWFHDDDDGYLKWRSYDENADAHRTLSANLPANSNVQLIFESSKWRGLATIDIDGESFTIDTYAPTDKARTQTTCLYLPKESTAVPEGVEKKPIMIMALNDKYEASEATEVWLSKVIIDEKEYAPDEVFFGGWLLGDDGCLKWRSYNKDAFANRTLVGFVPSGSSVQLVFDACKWRGLATVAVDGVNYIADTYAPTEYPNTETLRFYLPTVTPEQPWGVKDILKELLSGLKMLPLDISVLLTAFLLLTLIIFLVPRPLGWSIRGLGALLGITLCVVVIGSVLNYNLNATVTITALNEKYPTSEATEVWLLKVIVDGEEHRPEEIFSGEWNSEEEGFLKWRTQNKDADNNRVLTGRLPIGSNVQLVFDACKWRGMAAVEMNGKRFIVDTYAPTEHPRIQTQRFYFTAVAPRHDIDSNQLLVGTAAGLTLLAALSMLFRALLRKKRGQPFFMLEPVDYDRREIWLDVLKVVCAYCIVQIHTVGGSYQGSYGMNNWWLIHFANVIPRFAVPLFMMISGTLMLGREISVATALKKATKAMVVLIVWNLIYMLVRHTLWGGWEDIWQEIIAIPVKRQFSGHLWYIYFLVWMYLFSPLLSVLYKALSKKQRLFFVVLTLLIPGVMDLYNNWFALDGYGWIQETQLYMVPAYAGLMVLGRFLFDEAEKFRRYWLWGLALTLVGFFGAFFVSAFYCIAHGTGVDMFVMEDKLFAVLFAAGIFLMVKYLALWLKRMPRGLQYTIVFISKRSLGIYLFADLGRWLMPNPSFLVSLFSDLQNPGYTLLRCVFYFLIAVYCVSAMSEIPLLRKTVM